MNRLRLIAIIALLLIAELFFISISGNLVGVLGWGLSLSLTLIYLFRVLRRPRFYRVKRQWYGYIATYIFDDRGNLVDTYIDPSDQKNKHND